MHFYSHPIGQHSFLWSHLTTKEAGNSSLAHAHEGNEQCWPAKSSLCHSQWQITGYAPPWGLFTLGSFPFASGHSEPQFQIGFAQFLSVGSVPRREGKFTDSVYFTIRQVILKVTHSLKRISRNSQITEKQNELWPYLGIWILTGTPQCHEFFIPLLNFVIIEHKF